ncbi:MAG: protoporphyrinogen oxidase [Chloroherpetonaceae bacterium]|nr:protoporphyrinogen oxidase [Chloroherpetonaceae bacterium]MDW8437385.1 protoporphyrinogen oxidase [Chloroherpetonaceae bacterium]
MNVVVIGGGLAGLTVAYRLKQGGAEVKLLEASKAVGGKIGARKAGGEPFDIGANTVLESNDAIRRLIDDLGLRGEMLFASPQANARWILKRGKLLPFPDSPIAFLSTRLFSLGAKLRLLREPFIAKATREETLAEFAERRFGREILDYALNPFLVGVYAAKPEDLSARAAFKTLYELESECGSVVKGALAKAKAAKREPKSYSGKMFSFAGGIYAMIQKLSSALGASIERGAEAQDIQREDGKWRVFYAQQNEMRSIEATHVVFATPADATAALVQPLDRTLADALAAIRYSPVAQVFLCFTREEVPQPQGFGFLAPEKEERQILGAVYNSAIFPSRYQTVAFTVFLGGSRKPELVKYSDGTLIEVATSELQSILNLKARPVVESVAKWERAIPQYRVGHSEILAKVEAFEAREKTLAFAGNWRGGVSVPDTVAQAEEIARKLLAAKG